jgi:hypothetical protein
MTALSIDGWRTRGQALFPGVIACAVVAAAATFLSQHYKAPVMLFALLLGMAMNFLAGDTPCAPGIEFTARQVLRVGVALGLRITAGQVARRLGAGGAGRDLGRADDVSMFAARARLPEPVRSQRRRDGDSARRRSHSAALPSHPEGARRSLPSSACRRSRP